MDIGKLKDLIKTVGKDKIPYIRMEAGTNLIGVVSRSPLRTCALYGKSRMKTVS